MIENINKSEKVRRAEALAALGGDIVSVPVEVSGKEMKQMVSVRVDMDMLSALRNMANERGVKVSDLLREGAAKLLQDSKTSTVDVRPWSVTFGVRIDPIIRTSQGTWQGTYRDPASSSGAMASQSNSVFT